MHLPLNKDMQTSSSIGLTSLVGWKIAKGKFTSWHMQPFNLTHFEYYDISIELDFPLTGLSELYRYQWQVFVFVHAGVIERRIRPIFFFWHDPKLHGVRSSAGIQLTLMVNDILCYWNSWYGSQCFALHSVAYIWLIGSILGKSIQWNQWSYANFRQLSIWPMQCLHVLDADH